MAFIHFIHFIHFVHSNHFMFTHFMSFHFTHFIVMRLFISIIHFIHFIHFIHSLIPIISFSFIPCHVIHFVTFHSSEFDGVKKKHTCTFPVQIRHIREEAGLGIPLLSGIPILLPPECKNCRARKTARLGARLSQALLQALG